MSCGSPTCCPTWTGITFGDGPWTCPARRCESRSAPIRRRRPSATSPRRRRRARGNWPLPPAAHPRGGIPAASRAGAPARFANEIRSRRSDGRTRRPDRPDIPADDPLTRVIMGKDVNAVFEPARNRSPLRRSLAGRWPSRGQTKPGEVEAAVPSVETAPLEKTWTSRGQRPKIGSQVPSATALASLGSFHAEGTGLEPATPFGAPHFQSE